MKSDEASMVKHRYFVEHLPPIKPIGQNTNTNQQLLQRQPSLHKSSMFLPLPQSLVSNIEKTNTILELPPSSITRNSIGREAVRHSLARTNLPFLSPRSSLLQIAHHILPRRSTRYDHIQSKINTGLLRSEHLNRLNGDPYQVGPNHSINWSSLKQELEHDTQIRAQSKRIQFNVGVTYSTQLTTLSNLVRSKVKAYITAVMNSTEQRYKIVVQLSVFPTVVSGLHISSRCLWDAKTDNSITFRMQGVDCNLLIVVFLCYTELGII